MKTSELEGAALDWAVAMCDDRRIRFGIGGSLEVRGRTENGDELPEQWDLWMFWHPSTDWAQGGPIIEREWLDVTPWPNESDEDLRWQCVQHDRKDCKAFGPTPLIAAMRCYVTSKMGDYVDVPEELL